MTHLGRKRQFMLLSYNMNQSIKPTNSALIHLIRARVGSNSTSDLRLEHDSDESREMSVGLELGYSNPRWYENNETKILPIKNQRRPVVVTFPASDKRKLLRPGLGVVHEHDKEWGCSERSGNETDPIR